MIRFVIFAGIAVFSYFMLRPSQVLRPLESKLSIQHSMMAPVSFDTLTTTAAGESIFRISSTSVWRYNFLFYEDQMQHSAHLDHPEK